MTGDRLRDTFALLLREGHARPATLSADAERTIRRRIGLRWAGRIGALVVVGALGTAAAAGAYGGGVGSPTALESPIPTPTIGVAAVTFPVAGGPEFVSAAAGLKCGDPAPKPHPTEHDVALTLTESSVTYQGSGTQTSIELPAVAAQLSQTPDTELGIVGNSGISLIVARDGAVVGVIPYGGVEPGWNTASRVLSNEGQFSASLVAPWIPCPGDDPSRSSDLEAGTYDIVAMTRVFSTPESVALYQELGFYGSGGNLDPTYLDPQGIYLPGSYDCALTVDQRAPARGCLPDFTDNAAYDADTSTVTMLYKTKDFVKEFSAVLVSAPLTITIPGKEDIAWMQNYESASHDAFDSIGQFTCGATASYISMGHGLGPWVSTSLDESSPGPQVEGGPFAATALAGGISDGSVAELMPGARVVLLQNTMIPDPESNSSTQLQTVIGSAVVSAGGSFTVDRFSGPQPMVFTSEAATACPGVEGGTITRLAVPVLVGTWRVVAPDGTVTTVDFASDLSMTPSGSITYFGG